LIGPIRKSPCVDIRLPEKIPTVVRRLAPAEVGHKSITTTVDLNGT
jgi:hypothetical protein